MPSMQQGGKTVERVVVDAEMLQKLRQLTEPLELYDDKGHILARVTPVLDPALWGPLVPQVSEEELDRRERSDTWYTTAEVLAHLEKLQCSESDGNKQP